MPNISILSAILPSLLNPNPDLKSPPNSSSSLARVWDYDDRFDIKIDFTKSTTLRTTKNPPKWSTQVEEEKSTTSLTVESTTQLPFDLSKLWSSLTRPPANVLCPDSWWIFGHMYHHMCRLWWDLVKHFLTSVISLISKWEHKPVSKPVTVCYLTYSTVI